MPIDMKPVESSQIESVGYDADTQTLFIKFKGTGKAYSYAEVPQEVYDGSFSGSAGKHFGAKVRGVYAYTKLEEPKAEAAEAES